MDHTHDQYGVNERRVYPAGLGFEECSATVTPIGDTELTIAKPFVKEHEVVETRGWSFYEFNVTDQDFQVVVNVAEEEDSACEMAGHSLTCHSMSL